MSWDELRRQARSLENELDTKLAVYSGLSAKPGLFRPTDDVQTNNPPNSLHYIVSGLGESDGKPSNSSTSIDAERFGDEIEQLLQRLDRINNQMSEMVRDLDPAVAPSLPIPDGTTRPQSSGYAVSMPAGQLSQIHTAKRHRDILRDYTQEFRQAKAKLIAIREREELLGSVYRASSGANSADHHATSTSQSSATRLLLDEQERYYRSNRLMDDNLAIASSVRSKLYSQRAALRKVSGGLHALATRFPRLKQIITKIDWRHRKDTIILGLVFAFCILFLIIYRFS